MKGLTMRYSQSTHDLKAGMSVVSHRTEPSSSSSPDVIFTNEPKLTSKYFDGHNAKTAKKSPKQPNDDEAL